VVISAREKKEMLGQTDRFDIKAIAVRAYPVVMHTPLLDQHAPLEQCIEHLGIQQLVLQSSL
jgi:hypothetical protein